jgi:bifunctional enzyme CysN/CysC
MRNSLSKSLSPESRSTEQHCAQEGSAPAVPPAAPQARVFDLHRANVTAAEGPVSRHQRSQLKQQNPVCIWITGLPGSGKSTIAEALEARLIAGGRHTFILDGDRLRGGLNRDLGFTPADRAENVRRAAAVARLMVDAGLIVICAFISPYAAERRAARDCVGAADFLEIHLDVTSAQCEARDPKGHYAKARRGEITGFTGIDGSYEIPAAPDLRLDTSAIGLDACVDQILALLSQRAPAA